MADKATKFAALGQMIAEAVRALDSEESTSAPLTEGQGVEFHDEMGRRQMGTITAMLPDGRLEVRTDSDIKMTIAKRQIARTLGDEPPQTAVVGPNGAMAHARRARKRQQTATRFRAQPQVAATAGAPDHG